MGQLALAVAHGNGGTRLAINVFRVARPDALACWELLDHLPRPRSIGWTVPERVMPTVGLTVSTRRYARSGVDLVAAIAAAGC